MSTIKISSNKLNEIKKLPRSKSWAARYLILAALNPKKITLSEIPEAQDTLDLIDALKSIGLRFENNKKSLTILNSFPACEQKLDKKIELYLGEGGTTIRFLLPLLALGSNQYRLKYKPSMLKRPMSDIYNTLSSAGVHLEIMSDGVKLQGPYKNDLKEMEIDAKISSQFASAFELVNTVLNINLKLKNLKTSLKYFELTQKAISEFETKDSFVVPVDYSGLGYIIAYAFLNQDLVLKDIDEPDEFQSDSKLIEILKSVGGKLSYSDKSLVIKKIDKPIKGFHVDGSKFIDLVPTLVYIASFINDTSTISHIEGLKDKESNRLEELLKILNYFEVEHEYNAQKITIYGKHNYPKKYSSYKTTWDHRMVMCATLFMKSFGGGELEPYSCVEKSFPNFFEIF